MKDWVVWHRDYDDPESALSSRRREVTRLIAGWLDGAGAGPLRALSLCAGDVGDLADALVGHPAAGRVVGAAVELDESLAARAVDRLGATDASVEVRVADAGDVAAFADLLPVDLLLLVGVFGNVSDADVEQTVRSVAAICSHGATIIWTRHRREPDLTPQIRRWFADVGCTSIAFVSPGPGQFAIGLERFDGPRTSVALPGHLFRFVD